MSSDFGKASNGERLPRNYLTILDVVRGVESGVHLTAQDVFARTRERQPKLGFATVHRGLTRLSELGHIVKLDLPGSSSALYEPVCSPHAHFRCTACGGIQDVDFTLGPDVLAALAARHGVEIAADATTFAGRCAGCAATNASIR